MIEELKDIFGSGKDSFLESIDEALGKLFGGVKKD